MPKFALYVIPPANSRIYQVGSALLGYDVRAGAMLPEENPTREALPEFDEAWVEKPQVYGFHLTVGDALFFEWEDLPKIEQEVENIAASFQRRVQFTLKPEPDDPIPFWGESTPVLQYKPNPAMLMLHTLVVARVNPLGTGSDYTQAYDQMRPADQDPVLAHRIRSYYTPNMLNDWVPHFTLMTPYKGAQPAAMRAALGGIFPPETLYIRSICLLVRDDNELFYRLHREFTVPGAVPAIYLT